MVGSPREPRISRIAWPSLYCAGHYHAMQATHLDLPDLLRHNQVNYLSALHLLAALINLTETLYLDLHRHGVGVSLINPGFVDTPLTAQNQFKMPALISPQQAAQEILRGWSRGAFEIHFPKRFTWWMKALQLLPYPAFFAATRRLNPG